MNFLKRQSWVFWVFAVLVLAQILFIFTNSAMSRADSMKQSDIVKHALQTAVDTVNINYTITDYFIRKLAHFAEFSILAFLVYFMLLTCRLVIQQNSSKLNIAMLSATGLILNQDDRCAKNRPQNDKQFDSFDKQDFLNKPSNNSRFSLKAKNFGKNARGQLEFYFCALSRFVSKKHQNKLLLLFGFFAFVFAAFISVFDEMSQFLSGRAPMITDCLIDSSGALVTVLFVLIVLKIMLSLRARRLENVN